MPNHYVFRATNLPSSYDGEEKALQSLLHKHFGKDEKEGRADRSDELLELVKADSDDEEPYVTFVPTIQRDRKTVTAIFGIPKPLPRLLEKHIPGVKNRVVKPFSLRARSPSGARRAVSIDATFLGFTQMYPTKDGENIEADIIALHGLDEHPYGSWKSKGNLQHMWLRDSFIEDFSTCRTLIYGYDSNLRTGGYQGLSDFTSQLLAALQVLRKTEEERKRPIIWIAHSFGGLLLRQALLTAAEETGDAAYDSLLKATHGMLLFGVPHQGMSTVDHLSAVLKESGGTGRLVLLDELKPNSDAQRRYNERFVNLIGKYGYQIRSFIELQESKGLVVNEDGTWERSGPPEQPLDYRSALFQLPDSIEQPIRVHADHSDLVKFEHEEDETYRKVVDIVQKLKDDALMAVAKKFAPVEQAKIHFMVPYSRNKLFVGQKESRKELDDELGPDDGHRRLAVWGLGGVGKTQAVLDYIYQFQHQKSVFWIHAGTPVKFEQDYRKVAQLASLPGHDDNKVDIRPLVRDWFERTESGNWVLVLDNADNLVNFFGKSTADDGLVKYIPHGTKGTVLVTTRDEVVGSRLCDKQVLAKKAMDREDAINLFRNLGPMIKESEAQPLDDLLKELSYLPLAIAQAASYLRENKLITLTKYLERFQNTKRERLALLSKPFSDLRLDQGRNNLVTVLAIFIISFQQIEEQSPLAGSLLRVMVCINRQGMPVKLFESVKRPDDIETVEEALSRMISFSLLISTQESAVEMHAFIHLSAQEYLTERHELREAAETTAMLMVNMLPKGDVHEKRTIWHEYLPHASALADMLEELGINPADNRLVKCSRSDGPQGVVENHLERKNLNTAMAAENFQLIYHRMGLYYLYTGQYVNAERVNYRAYKMSTTLYKEGHPGTLASMTNLALTYRNQGRWKRAEKLEVAVMETRKRVLGEEHPDTLTSIGNLASTFRNQGRWKEAEMLEVQVMKTMKRVLGEEHPDTLTSMGNLASTYRNRGRWKEAEELEVQVMETRKRVLGEEHPSTLTSIGNLASTYWNQGRWKKAEELGVQVMEKMKKVLGEEHPSTLTNMANLASTYRKQGRWKEAEELQVQVIETEKRVLGEEHPGTLTSIGNLASTYRNQGRCKEAEVLEVQVMKTMKRVLGEEHRGTLASMANLASTYRNQGRWKKAEELQVQVMKTMKRVFGEEHPNTLTSMGNLALTYWKQGRWREAEDVFVQVMETRKRVLGEEHPSTLTSMANLASAYGKQGRWKETEEVLVQVMETEKRVLGEEHPSTLASMANLASTYRNQGRLEKAEKLGTQVIETRKRVLGEEHPDTLSSMANLASTFRDQGRWKEAEELEVRVMEMRKKVLGDEHPDTLSSMNSKS